MIRGIPKGAPNIVIVKITPSINITSPIKKAAIFPTNFVMKKINLNGKSINLKGNNNNLNKKSLLIFIFNNIIYTLKYYIIERLKID